MRQVSLMCFGTLRPTRKECFLGPEKGLSACDPWERSRGLDRPTAQVRGRRPTRSRMSIVGVAGVIGLLFLGALGMTSCDPAGQDGAVPNQRSEGHGHSCAWDLAPSRSAELDFWLPSGATLDATFESVAGAVAWNIHRHHGPEVKVLIEGEDAKGEVTHDTQGGGPVSLLWTNPLAVHTALQVSFWLPRGGELLHSTPPCSSA